MWQESVLVRFCVWAEGGGGGRLARWGRCSFGDLFFLSLFVRRATQSFLPTPPPAKVFHFFVFVRRTSGTVPSACPAGRHTLNERYGESQPCSPAGGVLGGVPPRRTAQALQSFHETDTNTPTRQIVDAVRALFRVARGQPQQTDPGRARQLGRPGAPVKHHPVYGGASPVRLAAVCPV